MARPPEGDWLATPYLRFGIADTGYAESLPRSPEWVLADIRTGRL